MHRVLSIFIVALLAVGTLLISCSERTENVANFTEYDTTSLVWDFGHEFINELSFIMFDQYRVDRRLFGKIYTPPGYKGPNLGSPYPVLYLLSPYGESDDFYFNHGLRSVADRLIAEGKIEPMIIVCIDGSNSYGGSFYSDSWGGGFLTEAIGDVKNDAALGSLIDYIDAVYNTISDNRHGAGEGRKNRGISGVGVGGYGAVRIGIVHDENFSALSAISAPLDFDGQSGNGGFVPLFETVVSNLDTTALGLRQTYLNMDTSFTFPLRTMFFAAASNFSPHDTMYIDTHYVARSQTYIGIEYWYAGDTLEITDTTTYFYPDGPNAPLRFHLPFDENGDPYDPIWQLWLRENPENLLAMNPGALDNTEILLLTSSDGSNPVFDFNQQTLDFQAYLQSQGIAFNSSNFAGYEGYDASGSRLLYDLFETILIFHSANFERPEF